MLLGFKSTTKDEIVLALASAGPQSASDLLASLPRSVSRQAVYQELRSLLSDGVVIKFGKNFALRFAWILAMQSLLEQMQNTSLDSSEDYWLADNKSRSWQLPNISSALNLWSHLTMMLFRGSGSKMLLEYVPHAWFHLISTKLELQFLETLKQEKVSFYLIVGNDTVLSRGYLPYFRQVGREASFSQSVFSKLENEYFSVIGDYIIKLKLPKSYSEDLDRYFYGVNKVNQKTILETQSILLRPAKIRLSLEHNKLKAKKLTNKFQQFFGNLAE